MAVPPRVSPNSIIEIGFVLFAVVQLKYTLLKKPVVEGGNLEKRLEGLRINSIDSSISSSTWSFCCAPHLRSGRPR